MRNLVQAFATRNLPEAFHTQLLVNPRSGGAAGIYDETFQFAAIPDGPETYSLLKYHHSLHVFEAGNRPVTTLIAKSLLKPEALHQARQWLRQTMQDCERIRGDYVDPEHKITLKNTPPRETGYCWRGISPRRHHAMASPPVQPGARESA